MSIKFIAHRRWSEEAIANRITRIVVGDPTWGPIKCDETSDFGGYGWQLDSHNDWHMGFKIKKVEPDEVQEVTLEYRYDTGVLKTMIPFLEHVFR